MKINDTKKAFYRLGNFLRCMTGEDDCQELAAIEQTFIPDFKTLLNELAHSNPWFDPLHVKTAMRAIGLMLKEEAIEHWLAPYQLPGTSSPKNVLVLMAGNLPAVGFHDLMCVLLSGHRLTAKLSADDNKILPWMVKFLNAVNPGLNEMISFSDSICSGFDAVIATGSTFSSRYFQAYFGNYPHIIRKSMTGVAILDGQESEENLGGLADDIFLYYGRGCRNVSMILVPEGYQFEHLFKAFEKYHHFAYHNKYFNNYEYQKAVMLVNGTPHLDNGVILLTMSRVLHTPLGVLHYLNYKNTAEISDFIYRNAGEIQCIAGNNQAWQQSVEFGKTQFPGPAIYADQADTIKFLISL
jgi:hypothetical protein